MVRHARRQSVGSCTRGGESASALAVTPHWAVAAALHRARVLARVRRCTAALNEVRWWGQGTSAPPAAARAGRDLGAEQPQQGRLSRRRAPWCPKGAEAQARYVEAQEACTHSGACHRSRGAVQASGAA